MINKTQEINELATALCKAQAEMRGVKKGRTANIGRYSYNYADLSAVIEEIKEAFQNNGLSYTQFPHSEHKKGYVFVKDQANKDQAKEVDMLHVGVTTMLMHTSGQYLEHSYTLPLAKQDPQAAGSAITYARRYALQSIAGIPAEDDDAEAAMNRQPQYKAQNNRNAPPAVDYVSQLNSSKTLQAFEIIVNQMREKGVKIKGNEALSNAYVANKARFEENKTH